MNSSPSLRWSFESGVNPEPAYFSDYGLIGLRRIAKEIAEEQIVTSHNYLISILF